MFDQNKYMSQKIIILFFGWVFSICLSSCQIATERGESPGIEQLRADVRSNDRYTLTEDRKKFEELRKDIPLDQQQANDEKSLYLQWLNNDRLTLSEIRGKFNALTRQKRENFNKDLNKIRQEYNKAERIKKDSFNQQLAEKRQSLKDQDLSREKRTQRYSELEVERKDFYTELREDRDSFEVEFRQKRKDFEDYIKEKQDEFNDLLKTKRGPQ